MASFHEGIFSMLDDIPQFCSVTLFLELANEYKIKFPSIVGSIKSVLMKTQGNQIRTCGHYRY